MNKNDRARRENIAMAPPGVHIGLVLGHPCPLLHLGFARVLEHFPTIALREAAATAEATKHAVERHRPAVLVLALEFHLALEQIRHLPRMLLLSPHAHIGGVDPAISPCAFASETDSIEALSSLLRRISNCTQPHAGAAICAQCALKPSLSAPKLPLSPRENEVFELIATGVTTARIADRLGLSPKTVETYRANIKIKLDLPSGAALTEAALLWRRGMPLPAR